jgi:hypothetical protein
MKCKQCQSNIKSTNVSFCSHKCKREWHTDAHTHKCIICQTKFIKRTSKSRPVKFCSNECKFQHQKNNPSRPRTGSNKKCKACGNQFYAAKWQSEYQYCSIKCFNDYKTKCIANGDLTLFGKYKHGKYRSIISGITENYDSSYELIRMIQLDTMKSRWTKKHGITIPYQTISGHWRKYIPDFLIDENVIEEVKPRKCIVINFNNAKQKIKAARQFCKIHGYKFRVITENKLKI